MSWIPSSTSVTVLCGLVAAMTFCARTASADEDVVKQLTGSVGAECNVEDSRPTSNQCAARFGIDVASVAKRESFVLALNDPIEYFRYEAKHRLLGGFDGTHTLYWLPPVLGGIRDRFVNDDPFDNTLLFTVVAGGLGYAVRLGPVTLAGDGGMIYVKQRFSPNALHSDEPLDPEANALYGFAQFGGVSRGSAQVDLMKRFQVEGAIALITLDLDGERFVSREESVRWKLTLAPGDTASFGFSGQIYRKEHGLRKDGVTEQLRVTRAGVFVEF